MSKKVGNINLTKEAVEGLKGFEDVFEDYVESEEYKERERKQSDNQKIGEQYELQHFLEQENARLTGLENFLTKKIPLKLNFSQTDKLIKVQSERKKVLREKLIPEVKRLDSALQKNLAQFFNSHFS
jgi:tRNA U34 5-carboxymethylaminomethyl modifying enzyme MnmG/GidA